MSDPRKRIKVLLVEASTIVRQGLMQILSKGSRTLEIVQLDSLERADTYRDKASISLFILNPGLLANQSNRLSSLKYAFNQAKFIAMLTQMADREQTAFFDDLIYLNDDAENICRIINNNLSTPKKELANKKLSKRELDVLKLVIKGQSNKQIGEALFISVHTVVTHRKNIIQKLGIKSTAGLAIYGVIHHIIDIDDYLTKIE